MCEPQFLPILWIMHVSGNFPETT